MASLFPVPREVVRLDPRERVGAPLAVVVDAALPAQGYELRVEDGDAVLAHADDAGRRYGLQTVEQLRDPDGTLPAVHVRDHPDVAVRGLMLDVSRDRVPTNATLDRLVAVLERCRFNHLQLYVEHTFAYVDHEDVWRDASPITPDDLRWLDERCAGAGIELAVNQNCFGHLAPWLALPRYRDRAECPDGVELAPGLHLPPAVLAPTADNADFVVELVREQLAALGGAAGRTVNVGCDETFELGRGASRERAEQIGVAAVYLEHLRRIVEPLLADGAAVQFWGDVLRTHPELLAQLPDSHGSGGDLTALVWTYDAPDAPVPDIPPSVREVLDTMGVDARAADFATHVAPFAEAGQPFWVAPGTSSWNSLVGRLENARGNLLDAATAAVSTGAGGLLVTDWGDGGHHQPPSVSLPPLAYGGAVAWCAAANHDVDLAGAVDDLVGDGTGTIGRVLEAIGDVCTRTGVVALNGSPLVATLFPHQTILRSGRADAEAMLGVLDTLDGALADLDRLRSTTPTAVDGAEVVEELSVATGLARHAAERMAIKAGSAAADPPRQRAELAALIDRYRAAWLARSRPGGLDRSAGHLERVLQSYGD